MAHVKCNQLFHTSTMVYQILAKYVLKSMKALVRMEYLLKYYGTRAPTFRPNPTKSYRRVSENLTAFEITQRLHVILR